MDPLCCQLLAGYADLARRERVQHRQLAAELSSEAAHARQLITSLVSDFGRGDVSAPGSDAAALSRVAEVAARYTISDGQLAALRTGMVEGGDSWRPGVGDRVIVRRLGSAPLVVEEVGGDGLQVVVRLGRMSMAVAASEVLPGGGMGGEREEVEGSSKQRGGVSGFNKCLCVLLYIIIYYYLFIIYYSILFYIITYYYILFYIIILFIVLYRSLSYVNCSHFPSDFPLLSPCLLLSLAAYLFQRHTVFCR